MRHRKGSFSLGLLAVVFCALFIASTKVDAADDHKFLDVDVRIRPSISIRLSSPIVKLDVTPDPSGTFVYENLTVNVSSNSNEGYTLYINTNNSELKKDGDSSRFIIPSLTDAVSISKQNQDNFTINHWGYGVGVLGDTDMSFKAVPLAEKTEKIRETDSRDGEANTDVTFAAKVNHDVEPGTYLGVAHFTAVTNFVPEPTFSGITTMQEMTADICANETTPLKTATETTRQSIQDVNYIPEAVLIDSRDDSTYLVRKLADGECWMTQNLRLRLTSGITLTSADTDISEDFTPTLSTQPTTEKNTAWGGYNSASDVNKTRSYDAGSEYGVVYNWHTATAGQGRYNNIAETTPLDSSICPKGWRLPIGYTQDVAKSFVRLANTYLGTANNGAAITSQDALPQAFNLQTAGYYNYGGTILLKDSDGRFWTASPYSSSIYAYGVGFSRSKIYPQDYYYKIYGFSIRCVAR